MSTSDKEPRPRATKAQRRLIDVVVHHGFAPADAAEIIGVRLPTKHASYDPDCADIFVSRDDSSPDGWRLSSRLGGCVPEEARRDLQMLLLLVARYSPPPVEPNRLFDIDDY
ncbi:MAG: hypothetical protein ACYDGN_17545 [Acidimicrobiales bacterium]